MRLVPALRFYWLLFLLPSFSIAQDADKQDALKVVTHSLANTALTNDLELSGTLHPLREAELSVAAEALVTVLHVDVGSRVKKGDLLLELDSSLAKQEHQRALAQLAAARAAADEAQRLLAEAERLRKQQHIAETEAIARESAVKLAQATLDQRSADARIAAEQLAKHRLYAPFDGVISARWTELGQWLGRGDQVFTLVSLDLLRLDVKLPQEHLPNIEHIKTVQIRPDARPELQISARIDTLVPVGDASRSFLLRVAAEETSPLLVPGASARALLRFEQPQNAVLLPRDALLRNPDGNYAVFIVENGKAQRRKITLGVVGREGYLIEEGLKAGEQVVIRGNELLNDGQPVTIVKELGQNP